MVAEMSYSTLSGVIDSWETIKRSPNFEEKVGVALFEKLFEAEPETKTLFGLHEDTVISADLEKTENFIRHAKHFINMISQALELLGPDVELLTDILLALGKKHVVYGVKPEYYTSMGQGLISVVKKEMGDEWSPMLEQSWFEVFGALAYDMIRSHKEGRLLSPKPVAKRTVKA